MGKNQTSFSSEHQPTRRRGKTKSMQELIDAVGKEKPAAKFAKALENVLGIQPKTFDHAHAMALYKKAIIDGDIKASELILKLKRQFPREEKDITTDGRPLNQQIQIEVISKTEDVEDTDYQGI